MKSVAIFYLKNKWTGIGHHPSIDILKLQPAVVTTQLYIPHSDTNSTPCYSQSFLQLTVFCTAGKIYFSKCRHSIKLFFLLKILKANHIGIADFIRSQFELLCKVISRRFNKIKRWQMRKEGIINNCKLIY